MSCLRRSQSVAPPTKRSSSLTGFVRIETTLTNSPSLANSPSRKRSTSTGSTSDNVSLGSRWLYAVLSRATLRCFARRADYKLQHAPTSEIVLDLVPTAENPKTFTFDHECLYVRCATSGKALTIRLHEAAKLNQWVTALYYQALAASTGSMHLQPSGCKGKSVSFTDAPDVSILPDIDESIDKDELFYSKKDYAEFRQRWKEDGLEPKSSSLVRLSARCK